MMTFKALMTFSMGLSPWFSRPNEDDISAFNSSPRFNRGVFLNAVINICGGFWGIIKNRALKPKMRLQLAIDLIQCILLVIVPKSCTDSYFFIKTFKYKVFFPNKIRFLYLFNEIFCKNIYPPLREYRIIIDAGANIGMATLWLKILAPKAKFLLFEPDAENVKYLSKNLKVNNLEKVKIIPKAISNSLSKKACFYEIKDAIQNLNSGLRLDQRLPYKKYFVQTTKLSNYIKNGVDLLKIDVEGSEYKVFDDLVRNNKLKLIKNIIFETHFINNKDKYSNQKLIKYLKNAGSLLQIKNSSSTYLNYFTNKIR